MLGMAVDYIVILIQMVNNIFIVKENPISIIDCNNNKFMLSVCSQACRDALGLGPREALAASLKESLKECMIMTGHK